MRNADLYRMSFPLAQPEDAHWGDTVVTEGHAQYCREYGHATYTEDGVTRTYCPRCGDAVTVPEIADVRDPETGRYVPARSPRGREILAAQGIDVPSLSVVEWPRPTQHAPECVSRAVEMAFTNGAIALSQALEWVAVWENDGGLANYGACTCEPSRTDSILTGLTSIDDE